MKWRVGIHRCFSSPGTRGSSTRLWLRDPLAVWTHRVFRVRQTFVVIQRVDFGYIWGTRPFLFGGWTGPMFTCAWNGPEAPLYSLNDGLKTSSYSASNVWKSDFNFHITNFPFLSSNIPSSPAYGVFIPQLIRYARASSSYECFILRAVRLSNKLLGQGYVKERLRSSLRKFYGRYGDLSKQYEVPLSRMLHDILDDDHLQWHPLLIRHYTNFGPYFWSWPYKRIWFFTLLREVSIEHLQRVRHANRGRLLLRTPGPVLLWDLQVF